MIHIHLCCKEIIWFENVILFFFFFFFFFSKLLTVPLFGWHGYTSQKYFKLYNVCLFKKNNNKSSKLRQHIHCSYVCLLVVHNLV